MTPFPRSLAVLLFKFYSIWSLGPTKIYNLVNKKIDKNDELTERTRKRLMLSEAKENYWKCYRDGKRMIKPAGRRAPRIIVPDKNMSLQEHLEDLRQERERKSMENIEKYEDWQDSRISVKTRFEEQEEQAETRTPRKRKFEWVQFSRLP